ncbi:hypothetical protein ACGFZP_05495 [Kitasatospora sp. NPDC048239]
MNDLTHREQNPQNMDEYEIPLLITERDGLAETRVRSGGGSGVSD